MEEGSWLSPAQDGELAVDVFRDGAELVVRSPMAGVAPENLEVAVQDDLLTVRGRREDLREINDDDWFSRECYWGSFSRSIVLPFDVDSERADAALKNGVLEIRIPIRGEAHRVAVRTIDVTQQD